MTINSQPNLPGYIITDKLGSGTYATVFKAYKTIGNREVLAVKCILKSSLNNISKENLLMEIKILKEIKHKYIVDMKDFQWDQKFVYILLEYCFGGDLRSYLDLRHSINEKTSQKFLQQLGEALQFLHQNKVLHLDLKPSNILLSSQTNPVLKLADFGFAMNISNTSEDTCLRGSLLYMAPEVYLKQNYDGKADLWSTGVILYECLYGQAPFYSNSIEELKTKITSPLPITLPAKPRISSECSDILEGLLQRNSQMRINVQHFVSHPFVAIDFITLDEKIQKANDMATMALAKESEGSIEEAIDIYCTAVRLYMQASQDEFNERRKSVLKEKAIKFVERAEGLKSKLRPNIKETNKINSYDHLVELSSSHNLLREALNNINFAFSKEESNDYDLSLLYYEKSIEILLNEIKNTSDIEKKKIIGNEASRLLTRAEEIKKYLSINAKVEAHSQKEDENAINCCIQ